MNLEGSDLLTLLALRRMAEMVRDGDGNSGGATIREIGSDDEQPSTNRSGSDSSVSNIEKLIRQDEAISTYLENGKHEEAYGLVKKQYKQGDKVYFLKVLVHYYVVLMQTDRAEKAFKIESEIISILQDTIDCVPSDAQAYAEKLQKESKYFETILFSHIAQEFCKNETDPAEIINTLQGCSLSIKLAVQRLIETRKITKLFAKKHIVPEMKKMCVRISRIRNADRKQSCVIQAICMHHLENTQRVVGDMAGREKTQTEAVAMMEEILGKDAEKKHVYSDTLNNLGQTYLVQGRPRDALRVLTKAVESKKKAEDYRSVAEKRRDQQMCENSLRSAQEALKSSG